VTISATPEPKTLSERFSRWADQVTHDLNRGTDVTLPGRIMKFLGAPGLEVGTPAPDMIKDTVQGPVQMMKGAGQFALSPTDPETGTEGLKNVAAGTLKTAAIPSMFVAPEAAEVAEAGLAKGGAKVAQAFSKTAVTKNMGTELAASLDRVASEAGLPASKATSLSGKTGEVVAGLKGQAQEIYGQLDKASGGRYQRFVNEIDELTDALRNKYTTPDVAAKLKDRLVQVRQAYADTQAELVSQGVDPAVIKAADSKWAQAKALEQVGKKIKVGESLSGELKPGTPSIDTGLKNLKPHILPQAAKGEAGAIKESVINATKQIGKVKRNQKVAAGAAAVLGTGAAGKYAVDALSGR
jgi:hypothetical protein